MGGPSVGVRRAVAFFLLSFGLAMGIAALADNNWVSQKDQAGQYGTYKIALTKWAVVNRDEATYGPECTGVNLDSSSNSGDATGVCQWSDSLLGPRDDWRSAGEGALGIGCIAVIVLGFAWILTIVNLAVKDFSKKPAAICAFVQGLAFFIGALVYEGMRPSWGGDMGYNYPIGLYMAAGLVGELAAIALWSADSPKDVPRNNNANFHGVAH